MNFDFDKLTSNPFAIGFVGALLGLKFAPGLTWAERLFNVVFGVTSAGALAPFGVVMLKLDSDVGLSALAFLLGLFGMNLAGTISQAIKDAKPIEMLNKAITRWTDRY